MAVKKLVCWNTKVGRDNDKVGDAIKKIIDKHDPDVICLQEAQKYAKYLRDRFDGGWWLYAKTNNGWEDSAMNPVMVKKQGDREKQEYEEGWNTVRYTTKWVGPQGGSHKGRTWTWVNVDDVLVMSLHRCTDGNGKNKEAFKDEYDRIVKWINNHTKKPWIIIGDHNCGAKADFPGSSKRIADHTDAKRAFDQDQPGIDFAIHKRINGEVHRSADDYGSDHEAIVWKTVT